MAFLSFKNIGISGISACVPKKRVKNIDFTELINEKMLKKTIKVTGIIERRIADKDICSSDLCYEAALKLFNDMNVDKKSIDMVIFVSQTSDFHLPATAPILQHRLGLLKSTAAFDVNLGCSGYVYGLSIAFAYVSQDKVNRVLLLVGDTISKAVSRKDRSTALLFGDGGTATLIEKRDDGNKSYFSLNSDGSGEGVLKIKAGGYRYPSSKETLIEKEDEDKNIRNQEQLYMNGAEVFNFTIREVPKDIQNILMYSKNCLENIDFIIYHQANKFITDFLTEKLKYPIERIPYSLQKYGNTSGLSIPLTIVSELKEKFTTGEHKVILSGFGVGLSWATALLKISGCHISNLIEV